YTMYEDRERNIWVGNSVGLNQLRKQNFVTFTKEQGLPINETTCVMEDDDGDLWVGTYGGGLCRIHKDEVDVLTTKEGLADNHVLSVLTDHIGMIWVGFDGYGVQAFDQGAFSSYIAKDPKANVVRVIFEDGHTNIWIGCNDGVARV